MARPGRMELPATIDRADVPAVVRGCLDAAGNADPVDCDAGAVTRAALPAVDALARIALAIRVDRRTFRLEHASPELIDLLELCGLRPTIDRGAGAGRPG